jgi:hypothetical protein
LGSAENEMFEPATQSIPERRSEFLPENENATVLDTTSNGTEESTEMFVRSMVMLEFVITASENEEPVIDPTIERREPGGISDVLPLQLTTEPTNETLPREKSQTTAIRRTMDLRGRQPIGNRLNSCSEI